MQCSLFIACLHDKSFLSECIVMLFLLSYGINNSTNNVSFKGSNFKLQWQYADKMHPDQFLGFLSVECTRLSQNNIFQLTGFQSYIINIPFPHEHKPILFLGLVTHKTVKLSTVFKVKPKF